MTLPSITATGRLGGDPEIKWTSGGKAVATFSLACDENRKNGRDEWEKVSTTWLRVDLWEAAAEAVAEHLKKGDLVTVIGTLSVRQYDKNDGSKGTSVEVKNGTVSKHLPRPQQGQQGGQQQAANAWGQQPARTAPAASDPWSTQPSNTEEPPF